MPNYAQVFNGKVVSVCDSPNTMVEVAIVDTRLLGTTYDLASGIFTGYNIVLIADKSQITADGIDTATVTATVTNWDGTPATTYASVTFSVNNVDYLTNCVDGIAHLPVTADVLGDYVIEVKDDVINKNKVTVSAV